MPIVHREAERGRPFLTYAIIVVMAIVMIHATMSSASGRLYDEYALRASYLTHGLRLVSVVTYMFLHSDWVHLLLNCFSLYCVGSSWRGRWAQRGSA